MTLQHFDQDDFLCRHIKNVVDAFRGARGDSSDCVSYEMSGRNGLMFEKSETSPSA
jgi:hypothetical protein